MPSRYVNATEAATMIRKELKARFPGVKFSVRSSYYSMGSSVNITWTDGPTDQAVRSVVDHFNGRDFDGMDDSWHSRPAQIVNGEVLKFQATVHAQRDISEAARLNAAAYAERRFGIEWDDNARYDLFGGCYGSEIIWRLLNDIDLTNGWPTDTSIRQMRVAAA